MRLSVSTGRTRRQRHGSMRGIRATDDHAGQRTAGRSRDPELASTGSGLSGTACRAGQVLVMVASGDRCGIGRDVVSALWLLGLVSDARVGGTPWRIRIG
jgi:hypothetical protein